MTNENLVCLNELISYFLYHLALTRVCPCSRCTSPTPTATRSWRKPRSWANTTCSSGPRPPTSARPSTGTTSFSPYELQQLLLWPVDELIESLLRDFFYLDMKLNRVSFISVGFQLISCCDANSKLSLVVRRIKRCYECFNECICFKEILCLLKLLLWKFECLKSRFQRINRSVIYELKCRLLVYFC